MGLIKCNACGKEVSDQAASCPNCGHPMKAASPSPGISPPQKKKGSCLKTVLIVFGVIVVIGVIANLGSNGDKTKKTDKKSANVNTQAETEKQIKEEKKNDTQTEAMAVTEAPTEVAEEDIPTEYKSALNQAKMYSDTMHMSKAGLYDQLTSEYGGQFPAEAAQYAVDNVEADWNANALEKAKTYQNDMSMSTSAIHDQLISEYGEKFTQEEADYAIANLK